MEQDKSIRIGKDLLFTHCSEAYSWNKFDKLCVCYKYSIPFFFSDHKSLIKKKDTERLIQGKPLRSPLGFTDYSWNTHIPQFASSLLIESCLPTGCGATLIVISQSLPELGGIDRCS